MMADVRGLAMGFPRASVKKQMPPGVVAADTDTRLFHVVAEAAVAAPSTAIKIRLLISNFMIGKPFSYALFIRLDAAA